MSSPTTCIYIASRGHSGSTLLEVLLARHPSVAAAGEVANLGLQCSRDAATSWSGQCGCGMGPFECPVWSTVLEAIRLEAGIDMQRRPFDFRVSDIGREEEPGRRGFLREPFAWLRKKYWRALRHQQYAGLPVLSALARLHLPQKQWAKNRALVLSKLAEIQGASAVVDSSKDPLGMRDMHDYSGMNVKILFLTRDSRGNAWSFAKRNGFEDSGRTAALEFAAREWVSVNQRIRKLLGGVPGSDWMHVRYEDLCRDPEGALTRVFNFVGLRYDPCVLDGREEIAHTIAGNKIRLSNTSARISEDKRWRENLDDRDQRAVLAVAGNLARELGYDV